MSGLTCHDARHLFDAHLDGELSDALETELNAHRLRCPACRHELALLEVTGEVIAADDGVPPLDDEFASRLLACLSERPRLPALHRRRLLRLGAGLLAAAAGLAAAVYFNRPEPRVAGVRYVTPHVGVPSGGMGPSKASAQTEGPPPAQATFQAQIERALTEWRRDASSLKKIYHFITPQIHEEMRLEQPENAHDQPDLFEPGHPEVPPEGAAVPEQSIEDI
ncbi:MAG: hypothetical protein V2A79_18820 [Planctomycetota bacterium]